MPYTEPAYPTTTSGLAQSLSAYAKKVASSTPARLEVFGHSNAPILGATLARELKTLIYDDYAQGGARVTAPEGGMSGTGPWGGFGRLLIELDRRWRTDPADYLYLAQSELALLNFGQNDLPENGPSQAMMDAIKHAYRTAISRLRQSIFYEEGDSSIAYTGTWGNGGFDFSGCSGVAYKGSTTTTDSFQINIPSSFAGGRVCLVFPAGPAGATRGDGADWRIAIDGGAAVGWDTRGLGAFSFGSTLAATGMSLSTTWRSGILGSGAHTIVVTMAARTGVAAFDGYGVEPDPAVVANSLPLVLVMGNLRPPAYTLWNAFPYNAAAGLSDADVQFMEGEIQELVAEFVDAGGSRVVYLDADTAVNKQAKYFKSDNAHLNPYGAGVLTELALGAIEDRIDILPRGYIATPFERYFQQIHQREGFTNSWVNDGGTGMANAGYRRDPNGQVTVRGVVKNGSSATAAVFTLRGSEGFRPRRDVTFPINGNGTAGIGRLTMDGVLSFVAGGSTTRTEFNFSYYGED